MDQPLVTETHAILLFEDGQTPLLLENAQTDLALPFKVVNNVAQNTISYD